MRKITELFQNKSPVISFELFPPKTDKGFQILRETIARLVELKPDFISCTYGAGGGSRDKTFDIVQLIESTHRVAGLAHLTCVLNSKNDIKNILNDIRGRGIRNILALRGDPPRDNPDWQPGPDNFQYASELCAFIRSQHGDHFGIGVAGFPEGHILCRDRNKDAEFMKIKIDSGADFIITQLFYNNQDYFEYKVRLEQLGIRAPVIPGILPITDYQALLRFTQLCGAAVPETVKRIFEPIQDDPEKTLMAGTEFAIQQCKGLLKGGAPGLHFYCLNKIHPVDDILKALNK